MPLSISALILLPQKLSELFKTHSLNKLPVDIICKLYFSASNLAWVPLPQLPLPIKPI